MYINNLFHVIVFKRYITLVEENVLKASNIELEFKTSLFDYLVILRRYVNYR